MKICCKDINYSFDDNPNCKEARNIAVETVKEMYEDNKRFEQEEAEEMLKDGDISDLSEYDFSYAEPFDEKRYALKISELTNKYMRNFTDVPKDVVLDVDAEKIKDIDESELKRTISEKYGVEVVNIRNIDKASTRDTLSQETYNSVGKMLQSSDYQTFLNLKSSMENYSFRNIAMIYGQKPDAQAVKGFGAWSKELNRSIIKGEHALKIWCPAFKTLKTEEDVDKFIKDNAWKYASQEAAEKSKEKMLEEIEKNGFTKEIYAFTEGKVFDISQTVSRDPENDNIEAILHIPKPLNSEFANYGDVVQTLEKTFGSSIRVNGKNDTSEQERIYDAVLRYSDQILSQQPESVDGIKSSTPLKGDIHKLETVAAASLICKHIGVESDSKTAYEMTDIFQKAGTSKEAYTEGKRGMFEKAFDRGSKLAAQFNKSFDKELGYDVEALRKAALAEVKAKAESNKDKYVLFRSTKLLKTDQWEKDGTRFTVGQNEKSGNFYAKATDIKNKSDIYIRDSSNAIMKFSQQPSHKEIEKLAEKQAEKNQGNENKKVKKKTEVER